MENFFEKIARAAHFFLLKNVEPMFDAWWRSHSPKLDPWFHSHSTMLLEGAGIVVLGALITASLAKLRRRRSHGAPG